jgi:MerR family mercuric resistance operon transcriptional regulator
MSEFTIGRLSARSGVNIETIRFYEKSGLIPAPPRSDGGRRLYDEPAVRRLRFIRRARELGFPLDEIRSLLGLEDKRPSCAKAHKLAASHRDRVRAKITDLKRLDRRLSNIMDECLRDESPDCALIEALARE